MDELGMKWLVELEPGIDALLHVSQISREHINKPSDVLKKGQEVTAKIVDFDEENKKISLSVKALLPAEDDQAGKPAEEAAPSESAEEAAPVADEPAENNEPAEDKAEGTAEE